MSFDIQRQIRENSQSIQEYYGDLLSWQKEVKSKTKAAPKKTRQEKRALFLGQESVSSSSGKNSNKGTRGVQGKGAEGGAERSSEREKGQQSKESEGGPRGKKKYARDGNTVADYYKAWDAFDVDAELEKASGDEEETGEEGKGASTRVSDLPQMKGKAVSGAKPNMRVAVRGGGFRQSPLDRAKEKKEEGNKLFASGALKDALRAYSQAADSLSAAFGPYLRDILKVRGGQDTEALFGDSGAGGVSAQPLVPLTEDQETAVREAWAAVLSNRALVSLKLGRAKETVLDCDLSLRLKPANAKAYFRRGMALQKLKVMDQAENDLRKALELDPQDIKTRTELQSVQAQREAEKVQQRKVQFELMTDSRREPTMPMRVMAVRDVTKREGSTTEEKGCKDSNSSKKEKEKEGAQLKPKPQNNSTSSSLRPSVESQKAAKGEKETGKEGEGALPPSEKGSSTEPTRSGGANSSSGARPSLQPQGPQTISNFYAFEREWRRLVDAGDAKGRMDLIQNSVRPSRLAPLVRDSLDSELLGSLIETLWEELKAGGGEGEEGAGAERVAEVLEGVAKLRRLSVVSQCLLDDEIEKLKDLFNFAQRRAEKNNADGSRLVSALRSGFGSVLES